MVPNYPHQVASEPAQTQGGALREDDGLGTAVVVKVRQVICGMHGHDNLLQFERDRMFLRCVSCGHETPGWSLTETPPTVTEIGDATRHAIVRQPIVGIRRIA
jgi:hypothetical protein